jgi:thiol-disulfide isomerase/thioredoxin
MFEEIIHNELSQGILSEEQHQNSSTFLKLLYRTGDRDIHRVIGPIYALNAIMETDNKDSVGSHVESFMGLLSNSSDYSSKAESYSLLVLKAMDAKGIHDSMLKRKLLAKVIHNIESDRCIDSASVDKGRNAEARRAWNRYVLSYSYFLLYQLDPDGGHAEDNLQLAVRYSPDARDRQVYWAYFYEAGLLTGNPEEVGFESLYVDFLMHQNRKDEALRIVTRRAVAEANDTNVSKLRALYKEVGYARSFAEYWGEAVNNIAKAAPKVTVTFPDNTTVDFGEPSGRWVYVDVWGTWCSPCRKELPELEKAYKDNLAHHETTLSIYSLSYDSKDIKDFMKANKYSFPVAEIGNDVIKAFEVEGYPTKILITPQGRCLKIPWGVNWQEYIKNYRTLQ